MSTPQPSAEVHAPAPDPHARDTRAAAAENPAGEENLYAHAKRALLSWISAVAIAVLNPGIALLQRLHGIAGGAQDTETSEDRPGSRRGRPGGRHNATPPAEAEAGTPKPRRRLRAFLVYLSVLLAGGAGGGVLAYNLLATLLDRQFAESRRLEAAVAEHSRSIATAQKKLQEAQAKHIETKKKLDETEKRLETMLAAERARNPPQSSPTGRETRPLKTGNCAMTPGNVAALKDCIDNFNR